MAERTWLFQPDMVHAVRYLTSGRRLSAREASIVCCRQHAGRKGRAATEAEVVDTSI